MTSIAITGGERSQMMRRRSRLCRRRSRRLRMSHPLEARVLHRDVAAWLELDRERVAALMPVVNAPKRVARRTIDRWRRLHDVSPFAMTCLPYRASRVDRSRGE